MTLFDRFADHAAQFVSRAGFFVFCVLLVVLWGPSLPLFGTVDTWQLVINTVTTCITFLLVALLQNTQWRGDEATNEKLDAIADGLADTMESLAAVMETLHIAEPRASGCWTRPGSYARRWASRSGSRRRRRATTRRSGDYQPERPDAGRQRRLAPARYDRPISRVTPWSRPAV